jgi:uncharacterized protein YggE
MKATGISLLLITGSFWAASAARPAPAQTPRTISVIGHGASAAAPDFVLVKGTVRGGGETSAAAHKAFEKVKDKLEKDFAPGEVADVSVRFRGEKLAKASPGAVGVVVAAPGGVAGAEAGETFELAEQVLFRVDLKSDMERKQIAQKLAAVIDQAAEAGVQFGQAATIYSVAGGQNSSLVEFSLADPSSVALKAYDAAIQDARTRGRRLAELAGGKLGRIVSVEELAGEEDSEKNAYATLIGMMAGDSDRISKASSDWNREVEVRQQVRVVFELAEPGAARE